MNIPVTLKEFLNSIRVELPKLIGNVLVGIYVYGSISYGDFEVKKSDVDIAVIIKRGLTRNELKKLKKWYESDMIKSNKWIGRLEMDYIKLVDVTTKIGNNTKTIRFAGGQLRENAEIEGASIDYENIRNCGIALFGPKPKEFMPVIEGVLLLSALEDKFDHLKRNISKWEKINLWNQVFIVVQLCRVVYSLQHNGSPISKKRATEWCARNLPKDFHPMIHLAIEKIDDSDGPMEAIITRTLPRFIEYIEKLFDKFRKEDSKQKTQNKGQYLRVTQNRKH